VSTFNDFYRGKTVLVTGHTGFKGSWLATWLTNLGAKVVGYAIEPPSEPACVITSCTCMATSAMPSGWSARVASIVPT
jgi:hypothetical protein